MKDILIQNRYRVDTKIGKGGFGLVYSGTDLQLHQEVAIKLSLIGDDDFELLESEAEIYAALAGLTGIPRFIWYGQECDYYCLIHELLGPSLEDLLNYCSRSFSLKTVLLIADQAITRIESVHSKGYLHRDVKPDNFLMGLERRGNILYQIDFGIADQVYHPEKKEPSGGRGFLGTHEYASLNAHNGLEQSWRDDLESLGYMLVYLSKGSLPWDKPDGMAKEERYEMIKEKKTTLSASDICEGLPTEFSSYLDYVRRLGFNEQPNYARLRQQFRRLFRARGFKYDAVFDWTEKLFYESAPQN